MTFNPRGTPAAIALGAMAAISTVSAQDITTKELLDGLANPSRWLTHSGDYAGHRFSPLTQITPANAGQLAAQWTFQTAVNNKFEATPIVIDGTLHVTTPAASCSSSPRVKPTRVSPVDRLRRTPRWAI